jgi:hypothetical protein
MTAAGLVIAIIVIGVFAFELGRQWWRENEWRRRWRNRDDDDSA